MGPPGGVPRRRPTPRPGGPPAPGVRCRAGPWPAPAPTPATALGGRARGRGRWAKGRDAVPRGARGSPPAPCAAPARWGLGPPRGATTAPRPVAGSLGTPPPWWRRAAGWRGGPGRWGMAPRRPAAKLRRRASPEPARDTDRSAKERGAGPWAQPGWAQDGTTRRRREGAPRTGSERRGPGCRRSGCRLGWARSPWERWDRASHRERGRSPSLGGRHGRRGRPLPRVLDRPMPLDHPMPRVLHAGSRRRAVPGGRATTQRARGPRPATPRAVGPRRPERHPRRGRGGRAAGAGSGAVARPVWRRQEKALPRPRDGSGRPLPGPPCRPGPRPGSRAGPSPGPGGRRARPPCWAGPRPPSPVRLGCHRSPWNPGRGRAAGWGGRPAPVQRSRRGRRRPQGWARRCSPRLSEATPVATRRLAIPGGRRRRPGPGARTRP